MFKDHSLGGQLRRSFWSLPPTDRRDTALVARMAVLYALLLHAVCILPYFQIFFGGWVSGATGTSSQDLGIFRILANAHNEQITSFFVLGEIFSLYAALVWPNHTYLLLPCLFFSMNTYCASWNIQDGGNNLCHLFLFFSLLAADKEFRTKTSAEPRLGANLQIFLMRFQIIAMYATALVNKLQGHLWQNGMALYYILQNDYFGSPWARRVVLQSPAIGAFGTYAAIVFQVVFCILVLVRQTRMQVLVVGLVFHTAIALTMNLYLFSASMMLAYASFLPATTAKTIHAYILPTTRLHLRMTREASTYRRWFAKMCKLCERERSLIHVTWLPDAKAHRQDILSLHHHEGHRSDFAIFSSLLRRTYLSPMFSPFLAAATFLLHILRSSRLFLSERSGSLL